MSKFANIIISLSCLSAPDLLWWQELTLLGPGPNQLTPAKLTSSCYRVSPQHTVISKNISQICVTSTHHNIGFLDQVTRLILWWRMFPSPTTLQHELSTFIFIIHNLSKQTIFREKTMKQWNTGGSSDNSLVRVVRLRSIIENCSLPFSERTLAREKWEKRGKHRFIFLIAYILYTFFSKEFSLTLKLFVWCYHLLWW